MAIINHNYQIDYRHHEVIFLIQNFEGNYFMKIINSSIFHFSSINRIIVPYLEGERSHVYPIPHFLHQEEGI